jgi:transposase
VGVRDRRAPEIDSARRFGCAICRTNVEVCRDCDHGNRYCGEDCAAIARRRACREYERAYRLTEPGKRAARDRQRRWRARRVIDRTAISEGLYLNPPDRALVLCVDEKSQIQALDRTQPMFPMRPDQVERGTHDYVRHGTTTLFAALDIASGEVIGKCFQRHRAKEFLKFLKQIEKNVPDDLEIHLILDNYATHKTPAVKRWLLRRPCFHLHFTPTKGSWLNQVERWFGLLSQRKIKRGSHRSTRALRGAIMDYIEVNNEDPKPFVWVKTADQILASIKRFCERVLDK